MGERIRSAREKLRRTQEDIARAIDVSKNIVSRWEKGDSNLRAENLQALAHELGVSADWLLTGLGSIKDLPDPGEDKVWDAFVATYDRIRDLTAEQLRGVYGFFGRDTPRPRAPSGYAQLADTYLAASTSAIDAERKAKKRR